jgi:hypothetical protein
MRNAHAVLAFGLLTVALHLSDVPQDQWLGLALVTAVLILALTGACRPAEPALASRLLLRITLLLVLSIEFLLMLTGQPTSYRDYPDYDPPLLAFRAGVVFLGLLMASYAWPGAPWARWRPVLFLGVYTLLGSWLILAAQYQLTIDVWNLQQNACAYLLRGENPYAATSPHYYGEGVGKFIAPELLEDDRVRSYPYTPLNLLLTVPGYLLGDVRWSFLAACVGVAVGTLAIGRRQGLPPGHPAELVAVIVPCSPAGFLVLDTSWTEPFLALAFVAGMAALTAGRKSGGLAWGAVTFLKQYGILMLPAAWASRRLSPGPLLLGLAVAALITLPFVIWDPPAFWLGLVGFHLYSPFRPESVSLPAAVYAVSGYQLPSALGFMAAGGTIVLLLFRQAPGLASVPLGVAATLIAFFLFNKAAHANYYWLACAVLAVAVVLAFGESRPPSPKSATAGKLL